MVAVGGFSPAVHRPRDDVQETPMCPPPDQKRPVVEPSPEGADADISRRALRLRIRQQEILAELGVLALQGASFDQLLNETARLTAEGLEAEFCKVMEYLPADNQLLVRAGVGWDEGVVGSARVGADLASPAGFALRTGKPVISNHLENEERFRTPELLFKYGIRRAMNVILQGDGAPFGVLEVDARSEGDFSEQDIAFLQGAANILGMAIERQRHERKLQAAVERQQVLLKEIHHRVKNSLQLVSSMLNLQASDGVDPEVRRQLQEASNRVLTIARAHERLYKNDDVTVLDFGDYLRDVCGDLNLSTSRCAVEVTTDDGVRLSTDRAIPLALIATELITNAAKYAYAEQDPGAVRVVVTREGDRHIAMHVRDDGVGLPAGFDPEQSNGLGMRIVRAFAAQLGAEFSTIARERGAEFVLVVPLHSSN
jgi:two-component sensor histidine kinase